jgi:hypothetical protein
MIRLVTSCRRAPSHRPPMLIVACAIGSMALLVGISLLRADHSRGSTGSRSTPQVVLAGRKPRNHEAVVVSSSPGGPGRLTRVHFYSRALGRIADYLVYLPADYTPSRRLPVFYGLHGMPGPRASMLTKRLFIPR